MSPSPFICSISGSADQARLRTVIIGYNVCRCTASSSVRWTRISLTPPSEGGVSAQDLSFGKFTRTMSKHFCENYCTLFPALKQKVGSTKCSLLGLQSALMPLSSTMFGVGCYILALLRPQRHVSYFWALLLAISICPLTHHGPVWQKRFWNAYLLTGAADGNYNLSIWMTTVQKCQGPPCCPCIPSRLLTKPHNC